MDQSDYKVFRGYLVDHLRRSLGDVHLKDHLPEKLAEAFEKNPDAIINSLADVLLPGVLRAQGLPMSDAENKKLSASSQIALQSPLTVSALRVLTNLQTLHASEDNRLEDGALLFCARGKKLLAKERFREAQQAFKRAIEIKTDVKVAWLGLAAAYEKLDQSELAEQARERAKQLQ